MRQADIAQQRDIVIVRSLEDSYACQANEWEPEWDHLDPAQAARVRARQGIGNIIARPLRVLDADGHDAPADGETMGEIAVSGNEGMLGYYGDETTTAAVTRSGFLLTGDLGVMHPGRLRRDP